jgi:hypothetical protein
MEINKIKQAAEIAKTRTSDKRWIAAIDKAVAGVENGWIVTELAHGIMVTTEAGTYLANGACQCKAFAHGQACKHRALARLVEIASTIEETTPAAVSPADVYCGCCGAPAAEEWDVCPSCGTEGEWMTEEEFFEDEVAATPREQLIVEIKAAWPKTWPPIETELLARYRCSDLNFFADDVLRAIRLAIAA